MAIDWMAHARQGRIVDGGEGEKLRVEVPDEGTLEARPGEAMRERGIRPEVGDTVLLRPMEDGTWRIARRFRFRGRHEAPLIVPAADPDVEYLHEPDTPGWLHPYRPYLYDWYDDFISDLPGWRTLAGETGGPVLELACGTGRIVLELARAGHRVTGVDFAPAMLDRARVKLSAEPEEVRRRVDFALGDMTAWRDCRRYPLAIIACNGLHYMDSTTPAGPGELRRRSLETLYAHLTPGGLGAVSNVAPAERTSRADVRPAPYLILCQAGPNPATGRWTAEYMGLFNDGDTGQAYDGPWRFLEILEDGTRRTIEFAEPPATPEGIRVPDRPVPLTRDETVALMTEIGFRDVETRSPKDLGPPGENERVIVFLGRRA
jgi:SAM-dependent methyltransferase